MGSNCQEDENAIGRRTLRKDADSPSAAPPVASRRSIYPYQGENMILFAFLAKAIMERTMTAL